MTLADALRMAADEIVALVGGGGKTTAMFRLAREVVDRGGRAITTTTTRIFGAQIALAPAHVPAADATRERVAAALAAHRHVLVIGATDAGSGKAEGVSLDLFRRLRAWFPDVCLLNEADGSRMRPFKAPADYEPVIPAETTLVVPVVGADVFGKPLDADHVHRPELVSALSGAPLGTPITPDDRGPGPGPSRRRTEGRAGRRPGRRADQQGGNASRIGPRRARRPSASCASRRSIRSC